MSHTPITGEELQLAKVVDGILSRANELPCPECHHPMKHHGSSGCERVSCVCCRVWKSGTGVDECVRRVFGAIDTIVSQTIEPNERQRVGHALRESVGRTIRESLPNPTTPQDDGAVDELVKAAQFAKSVLFLLTDHAKTGKPEKGGET